MHRSQWAQTCFAIAILGLSAANKEPVDVQNDDVDSILRAIENSGAHVGLGSPTRSGTVIDIDFNTESMELAGLECGLRSLPRLSAELRRLSGLSGRLFGNVTLAVKLRRPTCAQ